MDVDVQALLEVDFVDARGTHHTLSELQGRVVYVDLWGSWCKACMLLTDDLKALASSLASERAALVGINMAEDEASWRSALQGKSLPGLQWKPATPADEERLAALIGLRAYPRFLLLAPDGTLVSASAPPPDEALREIRKAASQ